MATGTTRSGKWPSRYSDAGKALQKGGFGEGRVLTDSWLERPVFLKTIHVPTAAAQLAKEVAAVGAIRSKYVVALYEVVRGASSEIEGIIYEYLPGPSLSVGMFPSGSNVLDYGRTLYQLASGIADIHSAGIVHRDIKLQNVRRDAESTLKIFDFGISSGFGDITNASRGTLFYLAPELFSRPAKISPAIDVYAFGACCWALVTSAIPSCLFERPPQSGSLVPSISTACPNLPAEIFRTIDQCLNVDSASRPSATDIRTVMHRHLVKDRHRAVLVGLPRLHELNTSNRKITLKAGTVGEIRIEYNGLEFSVTHVLGEVFVNNRPVVVNDALDGACVLTFGNQGRGNSRSFVELNASHPEVVL